MAALFVVYILYKCTEENEKHKTKRHKDIWKEECEAKVYDVQKFQRSAYFEMVPPGGQVIHTDHSF